ncbi:MAG: phosphoglycerate mutase [Massilia sp.]|nr:phosphoglycerate mutase [Massilia sp.]
MARWPDMRMNMRLTLVRHPAPAIAPGLCYGRSDVPVDPAALDAVLAALATSLPRATGTAVYSSPLQRCTALSAPLAAQLGMPAPLLDARLAEIDFGAWELRRWDDIPIAEIDAWAADLAGYVPGGGESLLQAARRVADFLDALKRQQVADAIVVCHAGTMRLLAALNRTDSIETAALDAAATPHRIDYGGILTLQF